MGGLTAILATALAAMTVICAILAAKLWRHGREAGRLSGQIQRFLSGDMRTPEFSVRDNAFSQFENAVVDLETRLMLCEEQRVSESMKSAELIVDISHQLKTPLASLRLMCELDDAPHAGKSLQLIEHMERMVRALLRLEKLKAGGYEFDYAPHALDEIAADAIRPLRNLFPDRVIELRGNAKLRCDALWLGEALINLIKNGCEHTRAGGHVRVTLDAGEASVLCTVQDDGGGVPDGELSQLFRRFFRSSTASGGGVGVGLAIVREIVQRHHGTICAENASFDGEGRGLKLTMCFPLLQGGLKRT